MSVVGYAQAICDTRRLWLLLNDSLQVVAFIFVSFTIIVVLGRLKRVKFYSNIICVSNFDVRLAFFI